MKLMHTHCPAAPAALEPRWPFLRPFRAFFSLVSALALTFALAGFAVPGRVRASESPLQLEGTTDYAFYGMNKSGKAIMRHHDTFVLRRDRAGTWSMETHTTIHTNGYFSAGYDGTNLYRIMFSRRHLDRKTHEPQPEHELKDMNHVGSEATEPYFFDAFPPERLTWFALASSAYLQQGVPTNLPALWRNGREDALAYGFRCNGELAAQTPSFPTRAAFLTLPEIRPEKIPTLTVPTDANSFDERRRERANLRRLQPGLEAAVFQVTRTTNFNGVVLPAEYTLEVYPPGMGINTNSHHVIEHFVGRVERVTAIESFESCPAIQGTMTVTDYRFKEQDGGRVINHLRYYVGDQRWKSMTDSNLVQLSAVTREKSRPFSAMSASAWGWGLRTALVVLLAALPIAIWAKRRPARA